MLNALVMLQIQSWCNILLTFMHRTLKQVEIHYDLVHGLCFTMSVTYFSSSTFHYTLHPALQFAFGKEPFSCRCWWTLPTMHQSGICHQRYFCWCSLIAAVVLPLQNLYTKCVPLLSFMGNRHVHSYFLQCTSHVTAPCAILHATDIVMATCPYLHASPTLQQLPSQ